MVYFFRLMGLLLLVLCAPAFAAISVVPNYYATWSTTATMGPYSSAQAACDAAFAKHFQNNSVSTYYLIEVAETICRVKSVRNSDGYVGGASITITKSGSSCPANSVPVSGTATCSCAPTFEEKNGQCVKPDSCSGLAAMCSGMTGSQKSYSTYDGDSETACYQPPDDLFWDQPKFPGCNQGCMAKAGPSTGVMDTTGKTLYKGMGTLTGGLCTYGTPSEPQAPDAPPPAEKTEPVDKRCAGQTGVVNGKEVCIPASSATGVDWTGSTTNSDGSKTEGKTTTTCSNGVCESTTVTTNKDANGNITGTTTKVDQVSQAEYCAKPKNSGSMICAAVTAGPVPGKDNNQTGGGGGSGGGSCTGSDCSDTTAPPPPGRPGFPGTGASAFGVLYVPKYPDGPVKLWADKSAHLKTSGLGALASNLMPKVADGGTAPSWVVDFDFGPLGNLGSRDLAPEPWVWGVIRAITILSALILARRLIFGG